MGIVAFFVASCVRMILPTLPIDNMNAITRNKERQIFLFYNYLP